ncbi:PQQ-dependent sugar dehydrogenase [Paradesertivirga mongoliensis]|uniref:PQQ-dependent sugar dehydrogenase n=1 Tax=Paradesertivirga mongoliensis TaxID=2100740 RepID=A0ABW4ZGU9_9SPHI|nr:PQQ-dependent sugar dehydrogenase [Pedobacter mongoliensis]
MNIFEKLDYTILNYKINLSGAVIGCALLALVSHQTKAQTAGLTMPAGFKAEIIAENTGRPRHITVTKKGDIYVKLFRKVDDKGILMLQDKDGDGKYESRTSFGNYIGTGIYLKDSYLYASSDEGVFRYKLDANEHVINPDKPDTLVKGLVSRRQHETKSLVLDNDGNMYVNIGAPSNSCQVNDRQPGSPGQVNCPILETAGGIWQFKIDKMNQSYAEGVRYATGLRNVVGLDWNKQNNALFVMQHGRDQLTMFPEYYDVKQSAELPAECMYMIKQGDNAGWPYSYYDPFQKKNILAPEYGGDGKKEADSKFINPVAAFPAHMAPNGLLFYTGNMFPERYKNGAFVAFHGSWNRAPEPQKGFLVAFIPFKDGKPSGEWETFADGFSGSPEKTASGRADHKPCGLAMGPDGALYVTDDSKGAIYKISYNK